MSKLRELINSLEAIYDRTPLKILAGLATFAALLMLIQVVFGWTSRFTSEQQLQTVASTVAAQDEMRKVNLALQRDMLALEKERKDLGLYTEPVSQLDGMAALLIRIAPLAMLFFSMACAWKVFEDQRSSRLRLALTVSFFVAVVGFVLILGGYSSPTVLKIGYRGAPTEITSESVGLVVIAVAAVMFLAALLCLKPRKPGQPEDEA